MNARISSITARETEVTYCGVPMLVTFDYEPGEPAYINDSVGGHPGYPANATLFSCKVGGVDIMEMLSAAQIEFIEDRILEQME